jgi:hypothetical protein
MLSSQPYVGTLVSKKDVRLDKKLQANQLLLVLLCCSMLYALRFHTPVRPANQPVPLVTMSVSGAGRRRWQSAVSGGGRFSCSFWQSILPAISERVHHLCFAETGVIHAALRSREDRERLDLRQRRRRKLFSLSGLRSSSPRRRRSLASTSYRVCPPAPLVLLLVSQTWALGLGGGR